ncbi:MAG: DUF4190 domain-containing protein [Puniceicoccales bacterium]|jgi:hypothetical protein|nr:DUF4190 domain-containing protein [Puniceicoccales bacterium]
MSNNILYYYISREHKAAGPVSLETLETLLKSGDISPQTQIAEVGASNWVAIGTVSTLPASGTLSAPPPLPQQAPAFVAQPPATESLAIASLVLGILGLFCLSIFGSIPAIVCGHMALSNIKNNPGRQGRGLAIGGLCSGYAGLLWTLVIVVWMVVAMNNLPK